MIGSVVALATATTLQPTSKWIVDFADSSCVLSRQYGPVDQGFSLNLKAPIVGKAFEIIIAEPQRKANEWDIGEGWIERPGGSRVSPIHVKSYSTEGKIRVSRIYVDPDLYAVGDDGDRLILHLGKWKTYDLAIPGFEKAKNVLEFCLKDLRKIYGVDEQALSAIAVPAKAARPVFRYFSSDDYPAEAMRKGEQGTVGALFWVEANGRVKECKVIESSQRKSLDEQTCNIIVDRARFEPAKDATGKSVRSPTYTRISWLMPR